MFLFFDEENLKFPEMVLTNEMSRNFGKYTKFLMSKVYKVFFSAEVAQGATSYEGNATTFTGENKWRLVLHGRGHYF